eukprot:scaffold21301_cov50-Phaeocystis_antarctica.AAC.1
MALRRSVPRPVPPWSTFTQLVVRLSLTYAHAGERLAAHILEGPHGPPTEAEDGDYAAGALGMAAPFLTAPHTVQTSYGAPPPLLSAGLRDGREAKVRPAAQRASGGRPSAGAENPSHSYHLSFNCERLYHASFLEPYLGDPPTI